MTLSVGMTDDKQSHCGRDFQYTDPDSRPKHTTTDRYSTGHHTSTTRRSTGDEDLQPASLVPRGTCWFCSNSAINSRKTVENSKCKRLQRNNHCTEPRCLQVETAQFFMVMTSGRVEVTAARTHRRGFAKIAALISNRLSYAFGAGKPNALAMALA